MLDRPKLLSEIQKLADALFVDRSREHNIVLEAWRTLSADETFAHKAACCTTPWPLPTWHGNPNTAIPIKAPSSPYELFSVDGSQVYPDRHQNIGCFLINTGEVTLRYGTHKEPVTFSSTPVLFAGDAQKVDGIEPSPDLVNALRQQYELTAGYELATANQRDGIAQLLLFDGSLVFWNLESKDKRFRDVFLPRYLATLEKLHAQRIPTASYISLPKSKELVNLVRLQLCNFETTHQELYVAADYVVDAGIARSFLQPHERSIIFQNNASISTHYPPHLKPCFFYLHIGDEVGRVELPSWLAQEEKMVDAVAQLILDQCLKGYGYPVALAEAHEQAVIKGPDREFFYLLLQKIGIDRGHRQRTSQKSAHKRRMGI